MSHPHGWALRLGLLIVSLCVGCDELAPQDYAGEYGLSIHGTAQTATVISAKGHALLLGGEGRSAAETLGEIASIAAHSCPQSNRPGGAGSVAGRVDSTRRVLHIAFIRNPSGMHIECIRKPSKTSEPES